MRCYAQQAIYLISLTLRNVDMFNIIYKEVPPRTFVNTEAYDIFHASFFKKYFVCDNVPKLFQKKGDPEYNLLQIRSGIYYVVFEYEMIDKRTDSHILVYNTEWFPNNSSSKKSSYGALMDMDNTFFISLSYDDIKDVQSCRHSFYKFMEDSKTKILSCFLIKNKI